MSFMKERDPSRPRPPITSFRHPLWMGLILFVLVGMTLGAVLSQLVDKIG